MSNYEKVREKVKLLELFYTKYGREPRSREIFKGEKLGYFLNNIRKGCTKIEDYEYERLEKLGFRLEPINVKAEVSRKVELLKEYYLTFGEEPDITEVYKGVNLGIFLRNIYRNGVKISAKDYTDLIDLGYSFQNKTERLKEKKIKALLKFYKKYGRLPKQSEEFENERIGIFLMNVKYGRTSIPKEYVKEFKKLGII